MSKLPILLVAVAVVVSLGFARGAQPILIYNPSQSLPPGFYVRSSGAPTLDTLVTVEARAVAPAYARLRDFADL